MRKIFLGLALVAMGCGDDNNHGDMGMADMTATDDMLSGDMATFTPTLNGTKLFTGAFTVLDTTSDDFAIVRAGAAMTGNPLKAYPLGGGAEQTIDPAYQAHLTINKAVLSWSGIAQATPFGKLIVWTNGPGAKTLSTASSSYAAGISTDSQYVIFDDNADGTTFDFKVAKTDGTGVAATGLTGRAYDPTNCPTQVVHAGTLFFITTCAPADDAGISSATISSVDPVTGTTVSLATTADPAQSFSVDSTGTHLFFIDNAGKGQLVTVAGPTATAVDAAATVTFGVLLPDDSAVIYQTGTSLKRYAVNGGAITTQVADANTLLSFTPDFATMMYSNMFDQTNGGDLSLIGTGATPGTASLLIATGGFVYGDAFTTDSAWALWFSDLMQDGTGTLDAKPVAAGAEKEVATGVWTVGAGPASKVVYSDNYTAGPNSSAFVDYKVVDVAGGMPTLIATQADSDDVLVISSSKKYFVYTFSKTKGQEAGYAYPLQ